VARCGSLYKVQLANQTAAETAKPASSNTTAPANTATLLNPMNCNFFYGDTLDFPGERARG